MDKVLNYLGLARRSRHLIAGTDSTLTALQNNKLYLIVLASDASLGTKDKVSKKAYFYKREFYVNTNVLTPRFDSEVLIENIIDKNFNNVLDLCTGSGCLGITIKCEKPSINLMLADISSKALKVCKKNCKEHNIDAKFIKTDMFTNIKDKFDLIICFRQYLFSFFLQYF